MKIQTSLKPPPKDPDLFPENFPFRFRTVCRSNQTPPQGLEPSRHPRHSLHECRPTCTWNQPGMKFLWPKNGPYVVDGNQKSGIHSPVEGTVVEIPFKRKQVSVHIQVVVWDFWTINSMAIHGPWRIHVSHEIQTLGYFPLKYWLFNRDPYSTVYEIIPI